MNQYYTPEDADRDLPRDPGQQELPDLPFLHSRVYDRLVGPSAYQASAANPFELQAMDVAQDIQELVGQSLVSDILQSCSEALSLD